MSEQDKQQQQQIVNHSPIKNGKRKALIIGISRYDHNNKFRDLDFCENDANEVYKILRDQDYDIPKGRLLVERVEWSKMRDEIIRFFIDRTLRPEDTLFFYFSGHGYLDKYKGRTYLATSEIDPEWPESRRIPFDELTTYLNLSNSERIVAVLDCCYSGAFEITGGGGKGGDEDESAKSEKGEEIASLAEVNMRKTVERLIKSGQGKCVLASSLEEQKSFGMKDQPYSTFTYFLIQGLKGAEGESVDTNGYVTPEFLGSYINKKMYELPMIKQNPIRKIEVTGLLILAYYPELAKRQQPQGDYLLQLLRDGKISEFNEIRKKDNYSKLNFYNVDLSESDLSYADLRNSDLNLAKIIGAKLHHVLFVEATLLRAHLSGADLSGANLAEATLIEADLSGAKLSEAKLSGADLSKADLSKADLSKADLSKADLSKADLSKADLSKADLSGANLSGANLSKAKLSMAKLSDANLSKANLYSVVLPHCDLSYRDLSYAFLPQADLRGAKLFRANLSGANLSGADLPGANLAEATLIEANLSGAKLFRANLSEADLSEADLSGANLILADLSYANLASSIIIGWKFMDEKHYPRCGNAKFDNYTIIDEQKLYEHFRNNSGNEDGMPPAIKDKKELREKLEKKGFDKETINRYLSFSSLPD